MYGATIYNARVLLGITRSLMIVKLQGIVLVIVLDLLALHVLRIQYLTLIDQVVSHVIVLPQMELLVTSVNVLVDIML
jgi:hypothetical protein